MAWCEVEETMQHSIVDAIVNLVENPVTKLVSEYHSRNRANNAGDALEEYVKDLWLFVHDCGWISAA